MPARSALGPLAYRRRIAFDPSVTLEIGPAERAASPASQGPANVSQFESALYPPRNSRAVVLTDQANSAGGAGEVLLLAGLSQRMEATYVGAFRQLTIFADAPTLATRVTWQVRIDGVPVPGLHALTMLFRAASSQSVTFDTLRVEVPQGKVVSVAITNVDGAARVLGAQLVGWTYPSGQA